MGRRQTIGMTGKTALENFMIELVKNEHMYYNKKEQMFVRLRALRKGRNMMKAYFVITRQQARVRHRKQKGVRGTWNMEFQTAG